MIYPTRCEIIDVAGKEFLPGIVCKTPDVSKPHIGKQGLAERLPDGDIQITLDDGNVLMGYECWWKPVGSQIDKVGG